MNTKKFIIAALAAFVAIFLFDGLWFGLIFRDTFHNLMSAMMKTMPEKENLMLHAFGDLCEALLFAWIYPYGSKAGSTLVQGIRFGIMLGLVMQLPNAIHMQDGIPSDVGMQLLWLQVAHGLCVGIIGGIIIAAIYGGKSAAPAVA